MWSDFSCASFCARCFGHPNDKLGGDAGVQIIGLRRQYRRRSLRFKEAPRWKREGKKSYRLVNAKEYILHLRIYIKLSFNFSHSFTISFNQT